MTNEKKLPWWLEKYVEDSMGPETPWYDAGDIKLLLAHIKELREVLAARVTCTDIRNTYCLEDCGCLPDECTVGAAYLLLNREEPPEVK